MDFSGRGGGGGSGGGGGRVQAERWLEIAGKLLAARDLVGCKRFAERAVEADPLLPGADELLAVADVLLAAQSVLPSGHPDPLAVLQVPPSPTPDHAAVTRSFRRLALLLHPRNPHPGADVAHRLVHEAFTFLSDPARRPAPTTPPAPTTAATAATTPAPPTPPSGDSSSFWTACPYCCFAHQYPRGLVGRALKCPNSECRRAFVAAEIPAAPPVVPGTDMYYCAWGFFPLGFPNAADLGGNWKPFYRMFPQNSDGDDRGSPGGNNSTMRPPNGSAGGGRGGAPRGRVKKTTARKKVGAGLKKRGGFGGVESGIEPSMLGPDQWGGSEGSGQAEEVRGININEEAKATDGSGRVNMGGEEDMTGFHLDVDATDDILGNLQHLPFLREDNLGRML